MYLNAQLLTLKSTFCVTSLQHCPANALRPKQCIGYYIFPSNPLIISETHYIGRHNKSENRDLSKMFVLHTFYCTNDQNTISTVRVSSVGQYVCGGGWFKLCALTGECATGV